MLHTPLFAQAAATATPPAWAGFVPFAIIGLIFYLLLIRPQSLAKKRQDAMIASAKTGDEVITTSGIFGTITNVKDNAFTLRIADNVKIDILKSHIATVTKSA